MAQAADAASGRAIRELGRRLAEAPDAEVARAVAVVDQLPERGGADQLIELLRPRLARMRPPRPLRFTRLLFLPLEQLIVAPPRWQPQLPTIPRSVLTPLSATVREGLGAEAATIDGLIEAASAHHAEIVARAGNLLWRRAAGVLAAAPPPVGWAETGLQLKHYTLLARRIGAVLSQAPLVQELAAEADAGFAAPRLEPIRAMLASIDTADPVALTMLVTLLLAKLPHLAGLLTRIAPGLSAQADAVLRQAGQHASETLLAGLEIDGSMESAIAHSDLADTAQEVRRTATLLRQLGERSDIPQMRARGHAIRQRLDTGCRARFSQAMAAEFLPLLGQPPTGNDGNAAKVLETTARHMRELESEARLIGGAEVYDGQLRQAAKAVWEDRATLSLMARVRLVEILAGSEAAMALLEEATPN